MIELLVLIILVEAITEIIVASKIMQPLREFLFRNSPFFGELVDCGYCTSVWVSASVAWIVPLLISPYLIVNYLVTMFLLHRLSNVWHEAIQKWLNRNPITFAVHKTEQVIMDSIVMPEEDA